MIDEAIVHVGMHKTGSSSIQNTLHNLHPKSCSATGYLKLNSPNHSGFFMTILSKNPEDYHAHKLNGRSKEEVRKIQARYAKQLESALASFSFKKVVVSAEDLSAPDVTAEMLENLKLALSRHCRRVRVIGYVRPPVGYMQSAFQQRLQGGTQQNFEMRFLWPRYRKRFETLDQVFGKENVDLVPFRSQSLFRGDVVLDIAARAGFDLNERVLVRDNESMSLEAMAILFVFRKFQNSVGYEGFTSDNNRLIKMLSEIGSGKLVFAKDLVEPVMNSQRDDIEWMNERLGVSIEDTPRGSERAIGSLEDLFSVATANRDALWGLVSKHGKHVKGEDPIAQLVDRLYLITVKGVLAYQDAGTGAMDDFAVFRDAAQPPDVFLREAAKLFSRAEREVATTFGRMAESAKRKVAPGAGVQVRNESQSIREAR